MLRRKDKNILDGEMKKIVLFKYLKGRFFSILKSSYVD